MLQLSCNLDHFVCQYKEQSDLLKSQLCEVQQNLEQLLQLPQKVEQVQHKVDTLEEKVEDLSCRLASRQESANLPSFFGALDRNQYFIGRKKELESLEKVFEEVNNTGAGLGSGKRKAKVHGICGLGGCGKSSLAFEYAWRNLERYSGGVYVINGESDELLRASLQGIHGQFVYNSQPNKHGEAKQFDQLMTETLSWLGSLREKWLLLLDNMDQKKLSSYTRKLFFGQWKNKTSGDILVTSRRSSQALCEDLDLCPKNCLELDAFSVGESLEFLKKRVGLSIACEDQEQGVKELVQELGGLPLALEQAAAYISALSCSAQSYLEQYREQKSILLNRKSAKPCSEVYSEARLAVQTTWRLNFSYIENDEMDEGLGKAASFFMKIATYLSPDEIPIEILNVGAPEIEHKHLKDRLKMPIGAEQIVDLLLRFSLFKRKSNDSLSIHRLVQETLKERYDGEGEPEEVFPSAIRMLHYAFINCVGGTDFLHDLNTSTDSLLKDDTGSYKYKFHETFISFKKAKLESRRWKMLSVNAFTVLLHLLRSPLFRPGCLYHEETARLACEAAFYCYSLGMESEGYRLQQFVFDILCAVKTSIGFYQGEELMKVTRILYPFADPSILTGKLMYSSLMETIENVSGVTGVPSSTMNQTKELLEGIDIIEPKARDAFFRGDYQASFDLYTEIVNLSVAVNQSNVRPLGTIFCQRGIANLRMENIETAVDDFNASINADNELYRGYYWKAYALCKLVENGRIEFTSRAQAAVAVLHYKFAYSKLDDIQKLRHKFQKLPGLLGENINYKFITRVNQLKELDSEFSGNRNSSDPVTVILAGGKYYLNKIVISKGHYHFVCLPGRCAVLSCKEGLFLSNGSFLFENVAFENFLLSEGDQLLQSSKVSCTAEKENLLSVTLGESDQATKTEVTTDCERERYAVVEANDVKSLVFHQCSLKLLNSTGVLVKAHQRKQVIVSVKSSRISMCRGSGIVVQGGRADSHISICDSDLSTNYEYGIEINSPACLYMRKNCVSLNVLGGIMATGGCNGEILRNSFSRNERHAILLQGSNLKIEENLISQNFGWGIVCCVGSNLECKQTVFENNYCGGLRIMLNGKKNVLVEKCEFRKNLGPYVFPTDTKEICPLELKCKQLSKRPREFPILFYLWNFLKLVDAGMLEYGNEFKSPVLSGNRNLDVPDVLPCTLSGGCSRCWQNLQLDGYWIECSSCHVARYCSEQCFHTAKAVHSFVCNSILEANKECEPLRPPKNSSLKGIRQYGGDVSLCVIAAVNAPVQELRETFFRFCLLTCPKWNLYTVLHSTKVHAFVMTYGSHIQESMMDIKAASILAKFDSETKTVTVYSHRIFPVDKVPNGWNCVNKTLDLFARSRTK